MTMHRSLLLPTLLFGVVLAPGCPEPPQPTKAKDTDKAESKDSKAKVELEALPTGPIAVVGGVEIPNKAFMEIYDLKVQKYAERGREIPGTADRRYRKSIAERLIWNEVLRQEAEKLDVKYDEAELTKRETQQKNGIKDWEKHLSRRGETEQSLRAMYVAELLEKALLEKQGALDVSAEEVAEDYEKIKGNWSADKPRVRASHILVPTSPKSARSPTDTKAPAAPDAEAQKKVEAEAKVKIDELYKLVIAEGAVFEDIAKEHSSGPSAGKGGDIGIFTFDRMAEEFSETAFAMEPGTISKPVKTKFGWHIIKVTGKWPAGDLPLEALEDQIKDRLRQRKLHQGRRSLKEELLAKYEVTDNIKPTLGPEPARRKPRKRGDRKGRPDGKAPLRKGKEKVEADKAARLKAAAGKAEGGAAATADKGAAGDAAAAKGADKGAAQGADKGADKGAANDAGKGAGKGADKGAAAG